MHYSGGWLQCFHTSSGKIALFAGIAALVVGGGLAFSLAQAFGEVQSYGHSRTEMIDGTSHRRISGFRLVGARTPTGMFYSSPGHGYYLGAHGRTWFRLGGGGR